MSANSTDVPANDNKDSSSASEDVSVSSSPAAHLPSVSGDGKTAAMPSTEIREDLVRTAVKFLQNPQVRERPLDQRLAFLERKGLNKAEIELSMLRSQTAHTQQSDALTVANYSQPPPMNGSPAVQVVPVSSSWTRLRDVTNVIILLTGAAYAVYHLYRRFIVPALRGSQSAHKAEDPLLEVRRSVDELRRSLAEVVAGLSETQSLMRTQQRQLDDIVRLTSGPEELERMNVGEVKEELKSLKALLLNRKQFPALPTMTPVIPAWQLQQQQNSADKCSPEAGDVECRTELKTASLALENSENQPGTDASPPETSEHMQHCHVTNGVTDGLENSDNGEIVENGSLDHNTAAAADAATDNDATNDVRGGDDVECLSNGHDDHTADTRH